MSDSANDAAVFADLLARLQALIGEPLLLDLGKQRHFFGLKLEARLERIETLPESESVVAYFSDGMTLDLAPGEQTFSVSDDTLTLSIGNTLVLDLTRTSAGGNASVP